MARVEIKNLPLIGRYFIQRETTSIVQACQLEAEKIAEIFTAYGYPLDLTDSEKQILQLLLAAEVSKYDPRVFINPQLAQKVETHFQTRLDQVTHEMGFAAENAPLGGLLYSPLDEIAQLWVANQDRRFIPQAMEQSVRLVASIRDLEKAYHPLESQLTFKG